MQIPLLRVVNEDENRTRPNTPFLKKDKGCEDIMFSSSGLEGR